MKNFEVFLEQNSNKFKIGIDVHGVITKMPEFFKFLTESIIKNGGECHIITGGSWVEVESELKSYGVSWTHYFSIYDYLLETEVSEGKFKFSDGTIQEKFDDRLWNSAKAKYCNDNNITLHIDDTEIYSEAFKTPVAIIKK